MSGGDRLGDLLLVASGIATSIPLLLFAAGSQRIRLSTSGILQFIGPTLQFLLGVAVYREPFDGGKLVGFGFVWLALIIYAWPRASKT